jgi:AcrR family transcriptional regulator
MTSRTPPKPLRSQAPEGRGAAPRKPAQPAQKAVTSRSIEGKTPIAESARRRRSPAPSDPRAAMLRAAGEILDEVGTDGLSTTAVARRANVSTGTVYREFADKHEIIRALTQSLMTERGDAVTRYYDVLAQAPDWRSVLADATRSAFELRIQRPGGRSTRRALQTSPELWQWDHDHTRALARRMAQALRKRKPELSAARAEMIAMVSLTLTISLFDLANLDPRREKAILEELIAARNAYLALYLD